MHTITPKHKNNILDCTVLHMSYISIPLCVNLQRTLNLATRYHLLCGVFCACLHELLQVLSLKPYCWGFYVMHGCLDKLDVDLFSVSSCAGHPENASNLIVSIDAYYLVSHPLTATK